MYSMSVNAIPLYSSTSSVIDSSNTNIFSDTYNYQSGGDKLERRSIDGLLQENVPAKTMLHLGYSENTGYAWKTIDGNDINVRTQFNENLYMIFADIDSSNNVKWNWLQIIYNSDENKYQYKIGSTAKTTTADSSTKEFSLNVNNDIINSSDFTTYSYSNSLKIDTVLKFTGYSSGDKLYVYVYNHDTSNHDIIFEHNRSNWNRHVKRGTYISDSTPDDTWIRGCTYSNYIEYDSNANKNDGTCSTLKVSGCTNSNYTEYDSTANTDDGSCYELKVYGCTDMNYTEYDFTANTDDGTCQTQLVVGCTDSRYINYNTAANTMDFSQCGRFKIFGCNDSTYMEYDSTADEDNDPSDCIIPIVYGCMNINYLEYNSAANLEKFDGSGNNISCVNPIVYGCINSNYIEYDTNANTDDGFSCQTLVVEGCTDSNYIEFKSNANTDDGTCSELKVFGCNDSNADNFDSNANTDDGTCLYLGCLEPDADNYDSNANTQPPDVVGQPPVCIYYGCTDSNFTEYDYNANTDDGTCSTEKVYGCTDPNAFNYDSNANTDEVPYSCVPVIQGCTDSNYFEYISIANTEWEPSTCETLIVYGCTNPAYINYDSNANMNEADFEASCGDVIVNGCMETAADNYNSNANVQPETNGPNPTCIYYGCTNSNFIEYDSTANTDNDPTNCETLIVEGCTDSNFTEYDSNANTDDGTCSTEKVYGCTDPNAFNYDSNANTDEVPYSCVPVIQGCTDSNYFEYISIANTEWEPSTCETLIVYGCTNPAYINYDSNANMNEADFEASCGDVIVNGCMETAADNYNSNANVQPETNGPNPTCVYYGCTDSNADNYDSNANVQPDDVEGEDPVCQYIGCTDNTYLEFDSNANTDQVDGSGNNISCITPIIYGCTDSSADNFNSNANVYDWTCQFSGCMDDMAVNWDSKTTINDGSCIYPNPTTSSLTELFGNSDSGSGSGTLTFSDTDNNTVNCVKLYNHYYNIVLEKANEESFSTTTSNATGNSTIYNYQSGSKALRVADSDGTNSIILQENVPAKTLLHLGFYQFTSIFFNPLQFYPNTRYIIDYQNTNIQNAFVDSGNNLYFILAYYYSQDTTSTSWDYVQWNWLRIKSFGLSSVILEHGSGSKTTPLSGNSNWDVTFNINIQDDILGDQTQSISSTDICHLINNLGLDQYTDYTHNLHIFAYNNDLQDHIIKFGHTNSDHIRRGPLMLNVKPDSNLRPSRIPLSYKIINEQFPYIFNSVITVKDNGNGSGSGSGNRPITDALLNIFSNSNVTYAPDLLLNDDNNNLTFDLRGRKYTFRDSGGSNSNYTNNENYNITFDAGQNETCSILIYEIDLEVLSYDPHKMNDRLALYVKNNEEDPFQAVTGIPWMQIPHPTDETKFPNNGNYNDSNSYGTTGYIFPATSSRLEELGSVTLPTSVSIPWRFMRFEFTSNYWGKYSDWRIRVSSSFQGKFESNVSSVLSTTETSLSNDVNRIYNTDNYILDLNVDQSVYDSYEIDVLSEYTTKKLGCTNSLYREYDSSAEYNKNCTNLIPTGCTDSTYIEYDSIAEIDDGSCSIEVILGCTDMNYVEYDFNANTDDGTCSTEKVYGCTDSRYIGYDTAANTMDSSQCGRLKIFGCTDSTYIDYDSTADENEYDGSGNNISCITPIVYGCMNINYLEYNSAANLEKFDGSGNNISCVNPIVYGCIDSNYIEYDTNANTDNYDGSGNSINCYTLVVEGCTDSNYVEFTYDANRDDGTCSELKVYGCNDTDADNFDSNVNTDDGTCLYFGCAEPDADNYDSNANAQPPDVVGQPPVCIYYGCMQTDADNYDPQANIQPDDIEGEDPVCQYYGCMDTSAYNYDSNANFQPNDVVGQDPVCQYSGCTDNNYLEFDSNAFVDNYDGSGNSTFCITPIVYGCMDINADNFKSNANIDDETCQYLGCTNRFANNYNTKANVNDGSCIFPSPTTTSPTELFGNSDSGSGSGTLTFSGTENNTLTCIQLYDPDQQENIILNKANEVLFSTTTSNASGNSTIYNYQSGSKALRVADSDGSVNIILQENVPAKTLLHLGFFRHIPSNFEDGFYYPYTHYIIDYRNFDIIETFVNSDNNLYFILAYYHSQDTTSTSWDYVQWNWLRMNSNGIYYGSGSKTTPLSGNNNDEKIFNINIQDDILEDQTQFISRPSISHLGSDLGLDQYTDYTDNLHIFAYNNDIQDHIIKFGHNSINDLHRGPLMLNVKPDSNLRPSRIPLSYKITNETFPYIFNSVITVKDNGSGSGSRPITNATLNIFSNTNVVNDRELLLHNNTRNLLLNDNTNIEVLDVQFDIHTNFNVTYTRDVDAPELPLNDDNNNTTFDLRGKNYTFTDSGGSGADYSNDENYNITFDAGQNETCSIEIHELNFEAYSNEMNDRLALYVRNNEDDPFQAVTGISWMQIPHPTDENIFPNDGNYNDSDSYGSTGYIFPATNDKLKELIDTIDGGSVTLPITVSVPWRFMRFEFTSDDSFFYPGWKIVVSSSFQGEFKEKIDGVLTDANTEITLSHDIDTFESDDIFILDLNVDETVSEPFKIEVSSEYTTKKVGCMDSRYREYDSTAELDTNCINWIPTGCTDSMYREYDSNAEIDDGSCSIEKVFGCTDSTYREYDSSADTDDGSCETPLIKGCMHIRAINYNQNAEIDDGSCKIYGCMSSDAASYDEEATINFELMCIYTGCTTSTDENYNPKATIHNEDDCNPQNERVQAPVPGCTIPYPFARNYNPQANMDDGSCQVCTETELDTDKKYPWNNYDNYTRQNKPQDVETYNDFCIYGIPCNNSNAINYHPQGIDNDNDCIFAGCDDEKADNYYFKGRDDDDKKGRIQNDGSCIYKGCTNIDSSNYVPYANVDDGSCEPVKYASKRDFLINRNRKLKCCPPSNYKKPCASTPICSTMRTKNIIPSKVGHRERDIFLIKRMYPRYHTRSDVNISTVIHEQSRGTAIHRKKYNTVILNDETNVESRAEFNNNSAGENECQKVKIIIEDGVIHRTDLGPFVRTNCLNFNPSKRTIDLSTPVDPQATENEPGVTSISLDTIEVEDD